MDSKRVFAYEFALCVGITSWGALKKGYAPWPPNIIYSTIAIAILSALASFNEKLAVTLGIGFLLALIVGQATGGKVADTFAALPPPGYDALSLGSAQPVGSTDATTTGTLPPTTSGAPPA